MTDKDFLAMGRKAADLGAWLNMRAQIAAEKGLIKVPQRRRPPPAKVIKPAGSLREV